MRALSLATVLAAFAVSAALTAASPRARAADRPEAVASSPPRTPDEERRAFHLPEGFVAELVAAEPDIHKPLNIAFDDQGRLWVTETVEYPFPAAEGTTPRDGVKILSDFAPDGRARKVTKFADGLNIPIGLLPFPSGRAALVHSIPNVYKLSDTDSDGKADRREPFYRSIGFKDTHGMTNSFTWGFDGWVYACHGFSNESRVRGSDGRAITMQSGNVYRMRPDGSHLEYFTHGQVNPFGLSFDPLGNLYAADCHSRPVYQLLRGAWYPSFGKPHDGLGFGPEMATHDHGSTAIAGVVYYAALEFPAAFRDTVFIGNVVTNRINHDRIEWHGSTPKAVETPDFLVSDDPWFRPVDLKLGPDGALYVADFYNRIIGHYEVPLTHPGRDRESGRIWRIVYRGKDGLNDSYFPPTNTRNRSFLYAMLGHPNLSVRTLVANRLLARETDVPFPNALLESWASGEQKERRGMPVNAWHRVHALWVLERSRTLGDATLTRAATNEERDLRVHAFRVMADRPSLDSAFTELARRGLKDLDPHVRRAAADALGRHPSFENLKPLLALRQSTPADDTHLIHVARMALRDQLRDGDAWKRLAALDLTDRDHADIADVAPGVPSAEAARFLAEHIRQKSEPTDRLERYVHHVARRGDESARDLLDDFLRTRMSGPSGAPELKAGDVALLKARLQGLQERGEALPDDARRFVLAAAEQLLRSADPKTAGRGIDLASSHKLSETVDRLGELVKEPEVAADAMAALAVVSPVKAPAVLGAILGDPAVSVALRERAATLLAQSGRPEAQVALLGVLPTAPERVQLSAAAGLAGRKGGAEALLDAVASGKASARLLQDARVDRLVRNSGIRDLSQRLETLLQGLPPADERVRTLIIERRDRFAAARGDGLDTAAGAKVFETHCAACHQIGGKGARIGPQLDGIGARGPDRLLEDVLDPSRNVDQTFRQTTLALKDGRVVSGLLLREEGAVLVMADAQGKEVRVPTDTVEERTVSPLSPMPANFAQQIPDGDFYRLIGYLLSQAAKK
jgi:putative heme-binding domain-containing protein